MTLALSLAMVLEPLLLSNGCISESSAVLLDEEDAKVEEVAGLRRAGRPAMADQMGSISRHKDAAGIAYSTPQSSRRVAIGLQIRFKEHCRSARERLWEADAGIFST